jgi:CRISPR-associated protein Cmr2
MNYTALTIGPILKTLQCVKSTKAIWAASYLFSYLIKQLIKEIKKNPNVEIILPFSDEINGRNPLEEKYQSGLFPDRIIIKGEIELQNIINNEIQSFSPKSGISVDFLKNFLNLYHLQIDLDVSENVILKINELLDSLELQQKVLENIPKDDPLVGFLEQKSPYNFLIRDEFTKKPFQSTIEISTAEFEEKYKDDNKYIEAVKKLKDGDDENQIEFIKDIKAIVGEGFRNYQKYIAVVQADGDNIGTFIKYLYDQPAKGDLIKRFSKNLLSFAIEAVALIKVYKGTPIYAGGDDLLFFAPVAHTQYIADNKTVSISKTILTLIKQLDDKFDEYFKKDVEFGKLMNDKVAKQKFEAKGEKFKQPSMSYGVSISYYKFPLNEALEEGVNQLFYKAKKTEKKNAVSYTILKHSGQSFGTTFNKDETPYSTFNDLITETVSGENFIHSIVYKLNPQNKVIQSIGENNNPVRDLMFDNFFENNFNENIHTHKVNGKKELIPFLMKTKELFKAVYKENPLIGTIEEKKKKNEDNILKIYSALRFIDFINNKEERNE